MINSIDNIFKQGSTTYYYASLFFSGEVKKDVFKLYAFVRTVDNLIDCPTPQPEELKRIEKLISQAWQEQTSGNKIVDGFVEMARRRNFEYFWIKGFFTAMKQDEHKRNYQTMAELEKYIYGSAEVVGLMMARILGLPKAADEYARWQGKAMQFVNFIRDVHEDEGLGRIYLPQKDIQEARGLNAELLRREIRKYREMQAEAEKGYRFIPKRYLVPIKTAADMYNWTANVIDKNPEIVWQKKVKPQWYRVVFQGFYNWLTV
jgi:15-cis-phytoene synthase